MQIFRPVVILAGFAVAAISAQDDMDPPPEMEGEMDETDNYNPESAIRLEDMISEDQLKQLFAKIDTKGAGKISVKDFLDFGQGMRRHRANHYADESFGEMDGDGDGKVTFDEASNSHFGSHGDDTSPDHEHDKARVRAMFDAADKNGDGSLDPTEAVFFIHSDADPEVEEAVARVDLRQKDKNGDGKIDKTEVAELLGEAGVDMYYGQLDVNKDGFLDHKEFMAWESGRFFEHDGWTQLIEHADANKDGFVTVDELLKSREQEAQREHHFTYEHWAHELEL